MKCLRITRDRVCPAVRTAVTLTLLRNARPTRWPETCSCSLAGLAVSNPAGDIKILYLVIVLCCAGFPCNGPIPRSGVFHRIFAGIADSNPAKGINISSLVNDLFCVGSLYNGTIPRPGEYYRMCVPLSVVKCSIQLLYLRRVDTKYHTKMVHYSE